MASLVRVLVACPQVLVENGVTVCHYFNPNDAAIQASCTRRALERPVPGQDAMLAHPNMQGVLCAKARRCGAPFSLVSSSSSLLALFLCVCTGALVHECEAANKNVKM